MHICETKALAPSVSHYIVSVFIPPPNHFLVFSIKPIKFNGHYEIGCICVSVSHRSHSKEAGQVLVLGQGDVGQLGLGEDVIERKKPALLSLPEKIVQVTAGGMHTVCLSETGNVSKHFSYFSL